MTMKSLVILAAVAGFPRATGDMQEDGNSRQLQGTIVPTIHFSQKISFDPAVLTEKASIIQATFPLKSSDWPMTDTLADLLAVSRCGSVVRQDDYEVTQSVAEMVELVGGIPPHAPEPDFWPWFEEVATYQIQRRQYNNQSAVAKMPWLNLPELWQNYTVKDVAEAVHDEFPGSIQEAFLVSLIKKGTLKVDNDIIPKRCLKQFLHGPVMYSNLNTWAIDIIAPTNFAAKYFVGRARPEEIAWSVHCSLPENIYVSACASAIKLNVTNPAIVPASVISKIRSMALTSMQSFTGYPEGSPVHPSWPAMHSAASSISLWLPVVASLTSEQWLEAKKTDMATAMARTVAGVHYRDDNIVGLNMGQEIVARELPQYLAFKYGSDPMKVRNKIDTLRFDWEIELSRLLGIA